MCQSPICPILSAWLPNLPYTARLIALFPLYRMSIGRIFPIVSDYLSLPLYYPPDYPIFLYYLSIYPISPVLSAYPPRASLFP